MDSRAWVKWSRAMSSPPSDFAAVPTLVEDGARAVLRESSEASQRPVQAASFLEDRLLWRTR